MDENQYKNAQCTCFSFVCRTLLRYKTCSNHLIWQNNTWIVHSSASKNNSFDSSIKCKQINVFERWITHNFNRKSENRTKSQTEFFCIEWRIFEIIKNLKRNRSFCSIRDCFTFFQYWVRNKYTCWSSFFHLTRPHKLDFCLELFWNTRTVFVNGIQIFCWCVEI